MSLPAFEGQQSARIATKTIQNTRRTAGNPASIQKWPAKIEATVQNRKTRNLTRADLCVPLLERQRVCDREPILVHVEVSAAAACMSQQLFKMQKTHTTAECRETSKMSSPRTAPIGSAYLLECIRICNSQNRNVRQTSTS